MARVVWRCIVISAGAFLRILVEWHVSDIVIYFHLHASVPLPVQVHGGEVNRCQPGVAGRPAVGPQVWAASSSLL